MTNEYNAVLKEAGPSTPVSVIGLSAVPKAGDTVSVLFEATLSDEIDGWFGMDIIDYTSL